MKETFLDLNDMDVMVPIVTMIIVLTRGKKRVKNPHLRAGLIACLECLVPKSEEKTCFSNSKVSFWKIKTANKFQMPVKKILDGKKKVRKNFGS